MQFVAQFVAVIGLIAKHVFGWFNPVDEALRQRAIMRLTPSQQEGNQAPFSICECMDLCVAPAARAANSLLVLPPFPPAAQRCALMWVLSIAAKP